MSRIHPSSSGSHVLHDVEESREVQISVPLSPKHTTLTVWKRSSMSFQGTDGFTVYDRDGKLAFRVDNYSRNSHAQNGWSCSSVGGGGGGGALVLMDGCGNPLLTLKPKIFSIKNQWNGFMYKEDDNGSPKSDRRIFIMRRPSSSMFVFGQTQNKEAQCEAEIIFNHQNIEPDSGKPSRQQQPYYKIEGSFWNRNCKIRNTISGQVAAKIMRKKASTSAMISGSSNSSRTSSTIMLSEEVFSLVVMPGFDPQVIMAFVVILDRICFKPIFTPRMCL